MSMQHPDYERLEYLFQQEETRPARLGRSPDRVMQDLLDAGKDEAAQLICPPLDDEDLEEQGPVTPPELAPALDKLRNDPTGDPAVLEVLGEIGLRALREGPFESFNREWGQVTLEEDRLLREIRGVMWSRIGEWYGAARTGALVQRRTAGRCLRRLGSVLSGDQRGKRRTAALVNPLTVREAYYRLLYDLLRAIILLREWPWGPGRTHLRDIASACGLSEAMLREYLHRDVEGRPIRPLPPEQAARVWIAKVFSLNEKTVSNFLSPSALPSPK